jgi:two-component system sensor histidine kinase DegS
MRIIPHISRRLPKIIFNGHFWLVVAMFAGGLVLHYPQQILGTDSPSLFSFLGLTRHALERVLFLLPVAYVGFVFGIKAGLASLALALVIMLPRVFLISSSKPDALFETGIVIVIGGLVNLWFESHRRGKEQRQQALLKLEAAQNELQSKVRAMERSEKRLAALNEVSAIVSQSLELPDILDVTTDKVSELMNLEIVLIFLLDEEAQELELKTHRGVSEEFATGLRGLKVGEGFNGRVAQTGEPMLIDDASRDTILTREVVRQEELQSGLAVPLKAKDKVVGTLSVAARGARQFLADEIELLSHIANYIGVAVENARLYQKERLIVEQLQVSEKNYRELFETASEAIMVHDLEGNIQMANKASEQLTGYTVEELRKTNVKSLLTEESRRVVRQVKEQLLHHQPVDFPYEQRLRRKDGSEAICMLTTSLITTDGKPKAFQNIARDVTEEKRMQENLRFYLQQVTRAQEEERSRIARELHDDTAQDLVVLSRGLDSLISTADHLSPEDIAHLDELKQQVGKILDGVRRFSQDLRPSILDDLGLLPALEWLTADLTEHFNIDIAMGVVGPVRRFPPETELVVFRIAQEALRNVWKHSGASRAWITLEFDEDKTTLIVEDNGKGFKLPERIGDLASSGKLGLAGMQERAHLIGGKLDLQSEPGKGTTVILEVPV